MNTLKEYLDGQLSELEMLGVVKSVGSGGTKVKPGDRIAVNLKTFHGECFFCHHGLGQQLHCSYPDIPSLVNRIGLQPV